MSYSFDPDLSRAATLPSSFYVEPEALAREEETVFSRTWQLVGREEQVRENGSFFAATVGREPLLVVRGADGQLRAMSNVCRHRAGPVVSGEGNKPVLQCGYHGWTYALDGTLLKTPEMDGAVEFEREALCLPRFNVDTWNQLIFVNLDPRAESLREYLGDLVASVGRRDYSGYRLAARKEWEVACNWKVYVDNYLEGYHIPIVHPSLFREIDYPNYRTEIRNNFSIQHAPLKRRERLRAAGEAEVDYYWLFPNLMLNMYPDNFSTNLIVPRGHDRTVTIFEWYFRDPDDPAVRARLSDTIAFSDEIQLEDIAICEAVQRGLRSRTYVAGRYSPRRENGVHHFHGLYARYVGL
ncbi:MAG TPA: aromatic ring-hydroxylating dioxygenase subunit alpha [Thermoanaerobaculia bacterium]|nr:aromatic ring-hydroxylating dioxygenase subunit alpha [Thermoanaerobaculia bacterium]